MNYPQLKFWQKSRKLAAKVYEIAQQLPEKEQHGLGIQLRETAVQIPTDIAIGANAKYQEFTIKKLQQAKAGLYKLETLILIAEDLEYIEEDTLDELLEYITSCQKLMDGYVRTMKKPKSGGKK